METSTRVLGRDTELEEIRRFVDAAPEGPGGLVLEGTPGIGKTTLWQEAIRVAATNGSEILVTRAAESEATLSYSALSDLFEHVADAVDLPAPQQRALDAALLRSEVAVPDQRAVSLAALGVVRALASRGPVVIAI